MVQRDDGMPVFYRPDGTCVQIAPATRGGDQDGTGRGLAAACPVAPTIAIGPYTAMARGDHAPVDVVWAIDILRQSPHRDLKLANVMMTTPAAEAIARR
jgi:hypothetical protein